jgi:hypothetical protein
MKSQKVFLIKSMIFMFALLIFLSSFQVLKEETISLSGVIQSIDRDFKFIVVNEAKFIISSNTKIVDEIGNILKIDDLKSKASVEKRSVIQMVFLLKKLLLKHPKRSHEL